MTKKNRNNTVVVAMSGGVDSSVAAAMLVEQGYNVIGVSMKMFNFEEVGGNIYREASCCGLDAFNDARIVAVSLGIPHYILDFSEQFGREVIDNFVDEYQNGRTPNPCVVCNQKIKWSELLKKADALDAEFVATGHYARVKFDDKSKRYNLFRSKDADKDQTYALWGLSQESLRRTIFPLADMTKKEVRSFASSRGIKTATKEESFEICFVADNDYRRFLKERFARSGVKPEPGDLLFDGKIVGKHDGTPFYTIGQRSGIGAHGEKVYVTEIDSENNLVHIGKNPDLMRTELIAKNINIISLEKLDGEIAVKAMVRYKDTPTQAIASVCGDERIKIVFKEPKRAITTGQSLVMYDGDKVVGGGIIEVILQ
ncbi:MAG: tRNA 2-thiouridine(34) synthase MnmA [Ignavibacteriales bacterium]|nr:tRNA 2-thiouridine(34) synthase MnmA [Ignavibacteriales bacterium]